MSEMLISSIVNSGFYLAIIIIIIATFRKEIRYLFISISSMKMGNSVFQFKDKASTFEAHSNLSEILLEILSERNPSIDLMELVSSSGAFKLQKFIKKYQSDMPIEEQNIEILKNVAAILSLKEMYIDALGIFNNILANDPENYDVLFLKSSTLLNRRNEKDLDEVEKIRSSLCRRFPDNHRYCTSYADSLVALGKLDEAVVVYGKSIENGDKEELEELFGDDDFNKLQKLSPNNYHRLNERIKLRITELNKIEFIE